MIDRIVGIRGFHQFDNTFTRKIVCRPVSSSINSKAFYFKFNHYVHSSINRVLDASDFQKGVFLIVEHDDVLNLAQINTVDLKKSQLTISTFSPPLPSKKFSTSKSPSLMISTTNVIGHLADPPTRTTSNHMILSDEQFLAIQDLCDEF